jgi:hypothetical protein
MSVVIAIERYPSKDQVPESVVTAERWLRKNCPALYKRISGWRDYKILTEINISEFQMWCGYFGESWNRVQPFVFRFCNCKDVTEEVEPIKKRLRSHTEFEKRKK